MKETFIDFLKTLRGKILFGIALLYFIGWLFMRFIYPSAFEWYTGVKNAPLTFDTSVELTDNEFDALVKEIVYEERIDRAREITSDIEDEFTRNERVKMLLNTNSFREESDYKHIKYFTDAGIRKYEGPKTCLRCHETMKVRKPDGTIEEVNTMDDIVNTVHFQFQNMAGGFTTYGYDGRKVNEGRPIPVGKIDRACGIPGSFSWTGWAELIETYPEHLDGEMELRSEGCGQCHIGGNYHPATERMMPIGDVAESAKDGIDCLICHSQKYDMNHKYVIKDDVGTRWNQDRTLKAAMTVTNPSSENCLNCHQHNMGGDVYANNVSAKSLGYKNKRLLHEGAKRGNPFSPEHDVHARAGVQCTDCHQPEGHKIPRGIKGTDLVANDLPGKTVDCQNCHTAAPHSANEDIAVMLNGHIDVIACETCHIKNLEEFNVVLRDWVNPKWNAEEGVYTPTDVLHAGEANEGFTFLWFNGNGTFLANALGNNPDTSGSDRYNPLMDHLTGLVDDEDAEKVKEELKHIFADQDMDYDKYIEGFNNTLSQMSEELVKKRAEMIDENIKPLQNMGKSKIYPFKLFNANMFEDLNNEGPFGAMILPFDYPTYYQTGKPLEAVKKAIQHPIVKRMYQFPFKAYMMDEFMYYFGVDEWSTEFPLDDDGNFKNVEPKWMRQYGTLMVNHGIQKEGRTCGECHSDNGILNFERLGYSPERAAELRNIPEMKFFGKDKITRK